MIEKGKWVRCGKLEAPQIRKSFELKSFKKAEIEICGLGMFELYLNGKKVSEDVLVPAWSEYEKRKTKELYEVSHRTYFMKYNITEYLNVGENTIGVLLGNGWYNQHEHKIAGDTEYDLPKLCFCLVAEDGDKNAEYIISDESLRYSGSYIYFNNMYLGEKQDLRLLDDAWMKNGFDDSLWNRVDVIEKADTLLVEQACPADKRIKTLPVTLVSEKDGKRIYDVGENMSGWMKVRVFGKEGEKVLIQYAEELFKNDGSMNFSTAGWPGQIQSEEYICGGKEEICEPHFTFHGFRYCEITGPAEPVEAVIVHSDVKATSSFNSDNEMLNWFYDAYLRTQLSNMHMGVPSDCPQRERLGYTGDGQICCDAGMLMFDSCEFYRKWIYDVYDCQDINTGHVHHTAPGYGDSGGGPGGWGCAIVVVPYFFWKHFGETDILKEGYPKMCHWIEYMISRSDNGLVVREEETGWCLGDWCTPDDTIIPPPYVNTYYLVKALGYMKEIAETIGEDFIYDWLVEESKKAICREYYDAEKNSFANSHQGADVFALDIGLGNDEMLLRTAEFYNEKRSFDTGIFGTHILMKLLFEKGYEDVAVEMLTSDKENTFGYMKNNGATTLWERWNGGELYKNGKSSNSHNHPMFGACVVGLFYNLLGFRVLDDEITIAPKLPKKMNFAEGSIETRRGNFRAQYNRIKDGIRASITVMSEEKVILVYNEKKIPLQNGENIVIL